MIVLLIIHSLVEQIWLCRLLWLCLSVLRIIDLELEIFSKVVSPHQLICLSKLINLSILSYSDLLRCQHNLYFTSHPWYSRYKSWNKWVMIREGWTFLVTQLIKSPPAMQETLVWFLGREAPLERNRLPTPVFMGFPSGLDGKVSACNAGDLVSIPGLGRLPWRRAWQPTPVFLPEESPWTEEPGGLQSMGSQRVGHNRVTKDSIAHQGKDIFTWSWWKLLWIWVHILQIKPWVSSSGFHILRTPISDFRNLIVHSSVHFLGVYLLIPIMNPSTFKALAMQ